MSTVAAAIPGEQTINTRAPWIALCYHDVQPRLSGSGGGPDRFSARLDSFECMLNAIARHGFIGCSMADAIRAPDARRVAITFDDGNIGQYENAFPALVARNMKATFYITTDWVGTPGFVSWDQLREMAAAGMSVQSHTVSHPFLSELTADQLRRELGRSKVLIDSELGQDTREIAFPGGDAPAPKLRHLINDLGYQVAVGSRWGVNRGPAEHSIVHRCTMRGALTRADAESVLRSDRWLQLRWTAKEATLRRVRSTLGASRYARWRRAILDTMKPE